MKHLLISFVFLPLLLAAQTIPTKHLNLEDGLAIEGYDPVCYFKLGRAAQGLAKFSYKYNGATYRFSSKAYMELFEKSPEKFIPQYGGWCAYAMGSNGDKVSINPKTFKIIDGKLYLFYNAYFNNTLDTWNKDQAALLKKANANWATTIKK